MTISKTNDLKIAIVSMLKPICKNVFYIKADKNTPYPYIVYYLPHSKDGHRYNYNLEVHIWTKDIKEVEALADEIEGLDNNVYNDNNQTFSINLNARNNVEDQDKEISHIRLLLNLIYYNKEG